MKWPLSASLVALGVLASGPDAPGQGTFIFSNRPSAIGGMGAPVGLLGDQRPGSPAGGAVDRVAGSMWLAQPLVNGMPLDPVVSFGVGAAAGFIPNTVVSVPGSSPGSTVSVQVAAWYAALGPTVQEALSWGIGYVGFSSPVSVTLDDTAAADPPGMIGLQGFSIVPGFGPLPPPDVPEPSSAVVATLGIAALLAFRARRQTS